MKSPRTLSYPSTLLLALFSHPCEYSTHSRVTALTALLPQAVSPPRQRPTGASAGSAQSADPSADPSEIVQVLGAARARCRESLARMTSLRDALTAEIARRALALGRQVHVFVCRRLWMAPVRQLCFALPAG